MHLEMTDIRVYTCFTLHSSSRYPSNHWLCRMLCHVYSREYLFHCNLKINHMIEFIANVRLFFSSGVYENIDKGEKVGQVFER